MRWGASWATPSFRLRRRAIAVCSPGCVVGALEQVGVEGTGSYGAGLARHLRAERVRVLEVDRPDRKTRRAKGKSDPIDAYAAARHPQRRGRWHAEGWRRSGGSHPGAASGSARRGEGPHAGDEPAQGPDRQWPGRTSRGAPPDELRAADRPLRSSAGRSRRAALAEVSNPEAATKAALRRLARRYQHLNDEIADLDADLLPLVKAAAPRLLAVTGVGPEVAGQLLASAGDNPDRLRSEAAFAHLCGVAPIPASSGRTDRHRLHRGGDRADNSALYTIVLTRLRYDPRTQQYMARRTAQGRSKKEVIRRLKRYVLCDVYRALPTTTRTPTIPAAPQSKAA